MSNITNALEQMLVDDAEYTFLTRKRRATIRSAILALYDSACPKCKHTLKEHEEMGWTCECSCPWRNK